MPMPMPICVQLVVSSLVLKAEFVFNKFVLGFSSFFLQDYGVNSICELHEHLIPLFYCFFHVLMDRKVCYFHPYASNRLTTLCFLEKNQQTLMLVGQYIAWIPFKWTLAKLHPIELTFVQLQLHQNMRTVEPSPISCISFPKLLVVVVFGGKGATSNGSNIQASFTLAFFIF